MNWGLVYRRDLSLAPRRSESRFDRLIEDSCCNNGYNNNEWKLFWIALFKVYFSDNTKAFEKVYKYTFWLIIYLT